MSRVSRDFDKRLTAAATIACVVALSLACRTTPTQWSPNPPRTPVQPLEFDLVPPASAGGGNAAQFDYNGSLLNPVWGSQTGSKPEFPSITPRCEREPHKAGCTSQKPTFDLAKLPNLAICSLEVASKIKGHVNWGVVAATGQLLWLNFATDRDFNFAFFPERSGALTRRNPEARVLDAQGRPERRRFIELEFDSRETVAHFSTTWWTDFTGVVRQHRRGSEIDRKLNRFAADKSVTAAVYGLLGLDCAHSCASEFHPVYALAIELDPSPSNNEWVIFVRNWGNEGFCSSLDHQLRFPDGMFRLTLPRTGVKPDVNVGASQFASSTDRLPFPSVDLDATTESGQPADRGSIVLTFKMPPPSERADAELFLTLRWQQLDPPRTAAIQRQSGVLEFEPEGQPQPKSAEDVLEAAGIQAAPESQTAMAERPKNVNRMPKAVSIGRFTRPSQEAAALVRAPRVELRESPEKAARDKAIIRGLCATKTPPAGMSTTDFNRMCAAAR